MSEPLDDVPDVETRARRRIARRDLPPADTPPASHPRAMRYAVLGGGKRIRPILAIAAAEACGADVEPLLEPIAALELIHTYSLVHDDLPALDNDDLRRGRKTTHVVFGEAMGILTGDALLTEAFAWLARPIAGSIAARQLRAVREVAEAIDSKGMIGGQVADIEAERRERAAPLEQLEFIHRNKTGKLLTASVRPGRPPRRRARRELAALRRYGDAVGLAFQIVDDLLDIEEDRGHARQDRREGRRAGKADLSGPSRRRKRHGPRWRRCWRWPSRTLV